jgi:hypothetical protein
MNYNFSDIVNDLNTRLFECNENFMYQLGNHFVYTTDGFIDSVKFAGMEIYNSEDCTDIYIEDEDRYFNEEEFTSYLLTTARFYIKTFYLMFNKVLGIDE